MNMRRVARYAGNEWQLDDVDPEMFLNEVLVPVYPDLRGAAFRIVETDGLTVIEYYKRAGDKG
jgi:hypothetical protein